MERPAHTCDVLVVGAGPIGIETAAVLADEGRSVVVVDAGAVGETIRRTFPPRTRFFTSPERLAIRGWQLPLPAQEKATGEEYLAYLRMVVAARGLQIHTFTEVVAIDGAAGDFAVTVVTLAGVERVIHCRTLVLAVGGTHRPRRLGVPGEDLPHVRSDLGDPHSSFQRTVLVVGGRNSAAESALRLYRVGARVHLVHREQALHERVKHWIRPEVQSLLAEGRIVGHMPAQVAAIRPDHVVVQPLDGSRAEHIEADDVLLQIGYEQDDAVFAMAGVSVAGVERAPVVDPATMASDVPGVFVVGTATAGTQSQFGVFIENSHQHADRVAAALAGRTPPGEVTARPLPET